jgi:hypothetical protein
MASELWTTEFDRVFAGFDGIRSYFPRPRPNRSLGSTSLFRVPSSPRSATPRSASPCPPPLASPRLVGRKTESTQAGLNRRQRPRGEEEGWGGDASWAGVAVTDAGVVQLGVV